MPDVATLPAIEQPRDAVSIAAAAGERAAELRHTRMVADLERWAVIVNGMADGMEPSGAVLAEVAELADRLRLPAGALAEDTAAVLAVRKLTDRLDTARASLERNQLDMPARRAALDAARRRVRELETELATGATLPAGIASKEAALADLRSRNPRLYGDAAGLARRMLRDGVARGWTDTTTTPRP